ncbi:MAG: hypothetical protein IPH75_00225 [bacterium]|nr:hypothetical protein [bacterium]
MANYRSVIACGLKFLCVLLLAIQVEAAWSPATNQYSTMEVISPEPDLPAQVASVASQGEPDIGANWQGADRWMRGISWSGEAFFQSIGKGKSFFGSNLSDAGYFPVKIEFSTTTTSVCRTFRRDLGYASAGVGTFPGAAYDVTDPLNPRRLNLCFVEDAGQGAANLTWDPNSNSVGKREYLFVMASDYDGTGSTYNGFNIFSGASGMDIIYAWWPQLETGKTLLQTLLPDPPYVKPPASLFGSTPASVGCRPTRADQRLDLLLSYSCGRWRRDVCGPELRTVFLRPEYVVEHTVVGSLE